MTKVLCFCHSKPYSHHLVTTLERVFSQCNCRPMKCFHLNLLLPDSFRQQQHSTTLEYQPKSISDDHNGAARYLRSHQPYITAMLESGSKQEWHGSFPTLENANSALNELFDETWLGAEDNLCLGEVEKDTDGCLFLQWSVRGHEETYELPTVKKPALDDKGPQSPSADVHEPGHDPTPCVLPNEDTHNTSLNSILQDDHRRSELVSKIIETHDGLNMVVDSLLEDEEMSNYLALQVLERDFDAALKKLSGDQDLMFYLADQVLECDLGAVRKMIAGNPDIMERFTERILEEDFDALVDSILEDADAVRYLAEMMVGNKCDAVLDKLLQHSDMASEVIREALKCDRGMVVDKLLKAAETREQLVQQVLEGTESKQDFLASLMAGESHKAEYTRSIRSNEGLEDYLEYDIKEEYKMNVARSSCSRSDMRSRDS